MVLSSPGSPCKAYLWFSCWDEPEAARSSASLPAAWLSAGHNNTGLNVVCSHDPLFSLSLSLLQGKALAVCPGCSRQSNSSWAEPAVTPLCQGSSVSAAAEDGSGYLMML